MLRWSLYSSLVSLLNLLQQTFLLMVSQNGAIDMHAVQFELFQFPLVPPVTPIWYLLYSRTHELYTQHLNAFKAKLG